MIDRWSAFLVRRAWAVLLVGLALVFAAAAYGGGVFESLSQGGFEDPDSEFQREFVVEQETFGNRAVDVVAVYTSADLTADAPAFRAAVDATLAGIPADLVTAVVPWYEIGDPRLVSGEPEPDLTPV